MRVSFVLLAAAASLLSASDVASAATITDQAKLSQVNSYDAVEPIDAVQANVVAKRFLRKYKEEEEDSEEDPDHEDRGFPVNANMLDDAVTKTTLATHTKEVNAVLEKAMPGFKPYNDKSLWGLMTPKILEFSRTDPEMTLFRVMYDGKVSLRRFAFMMQHSLSGNVVHNFEDVYKKYKWYLYFRHAGGKPHA
ncbi:putative secreted RxLR effector protein [Phytophthora cinnamomi]|uniref:putative secreted RxLR effector protein n=1 Tax=Phytophthora cinnamomi TaxID=4785 RepID=UPI002B318BD2|nr:putative secreted RxLR effector protein [Phytophthora cinnamomi]QVE55551.1 RxLR effector protein 43 [Phytophthora cinnamomi]